MIQDIAPKVFHNSFKNKQAEPTDLFLSYNGDTVLVREDKDKLWYPSFLDFEEKYPNLNDDAKFLFNIDDINYYLVDENNLEVEGWAYVSTNRFRTEVKY